MELLNIILQANVAAGTGGASGESYFSLIAKGGPILIPIFLLSILAVYLSVDKWFQIKKLSTKDYAGMTTLIKLIENNEIDRAYVHAARKPYSSFKVIAAGLKEDTTSIADVEEAMEMESRMQIAVLENHMNYLAITASIAPMLGFLGTIFGVIRIFYDIAASGILDISTISNGLYEKMICSGAGLFVGIIAYSGYSLLNGKIDKAVLQMDIFSNQALKAIKLNNKAQNQ